MAVPTSITGAKLVGANTWQASLMSAKAQLTPNIRRALTLVGQAVSTHAKIRVPVYGPPKGAGRDKETGRFKKKSEGEGRGRGGTLRQSIRYEVVGAGALVMQARIGTNEDYGVFVEYGTDRIAGGGVKNLGVGDDIHDHDAYHMWPALAARGGSEQQMPWLRPAANFVKPQARALLQGALNGTLRASGFKVSKGGGTM